MSAPAAPQRGEEEQRRTVFSVSSRAGLAVARSDPHVAMLHTEKFYSAGEVDEEHAPRLAPLFDQRSNAAAVAQLYSAIRLHAVPWPVANEAFLSAMQYQLAVMERSARPESPPPPADRRDDFRLYIRKYTEGVKSFADFVLTATLVTASTVAMALPSKVRSNATNEERTGVSVLQ
ncbi:MAG: hypothetical protein ACPL3C_09205 [Pyrobaculum sp.]|uniref:hypothetical protein n=1 Tax=Pyrobaculum sp. TaxID=2004705 RepID=UPI003CB07687